MITFSEDIAIHVAMAPVDMRCGINRLVVRVLDVFNVKPQDKACFIFYNKNRDRIKLLLWHGNGFVLLHKRLEQNKFCFPKTFHTETLVITHQQLQGLLYGFDFIRLKDYPNLRFEHYI